MTRWRGVWASFPALILGCTPLEPEPAAPKLGDSAVEVPAEVVVSEEQPAFDGYPDCDLISKDELFSGVCPLVDLAVDHMPERQCAPRGFRRAAHPLPVPGLRYYIGHVACSDSPPVGCFEQDGQTLYCTSEKDLSVLLQRTGIASRLEESQVRWLAEAFLFHPIIDGPTWRIPSDVRGPGDARVVYPPSTCRTAEGGLQIQYSYLRMMSGYANGYLRVEPEGTVDTGDIPPTPCP